MEQTYLVDLSSLLLSSLIMKTIVCLFLALLCTQVFATDPQPVRHAESILAFSGESLHQGVQLSWQMKIEAEIKGFVIERSLDGEYFSAIEWIPFQGSHVHLIGYEFLDNYPPEADYMHYRLRVIDRSEAVAYSDPIQVGMQVTEIRTQYNSATQQLLVLNSTDYPVTANLIRLKGNVVLTRSFDKSDQVETYDLPAIPGDVYLLQIEYREGIILEKRLQL